MYTIQIFISYSWTCGLNVKHYMQLNFAKRLRHVLFFCPFRAFNLFTSTLGVALGCMLIGLSGRFSFYYSLLLNVDKLLFQAVHQIITLIC